MLPHIAVLVVALWTAWRPAETVAATPVVLALTALLLVVWAHRRTPRVAMATGLTAVGLLLASLSVSALGGWDRSTATAELALVAAVAALVWVSSRERPPVLVTRLLALGIAALAGWGLWQVTVGLERARTAIAVLPAELQANAIERLDSGRAFASLLLPGHLAVLFAAALPILVAAVRPSRRSAAWAVGACMCVAGLLMTRSPIGIGLAALGLTALLLKRRTRVAGVGALALVVGLVLTVIWRPDVGALDPVRLRIDNWQTALWAWSGSPLTGVGLGGYGQATQAVPFAVGNRPAHAHCLPLEWAAELGVIGVLLFAAAAWWLVRLMIRLWPRRPELAVAIGVVALHNLVDFSLYTSGVAVPWAVLVGWAAVEAWPPEENAGPGRGRALLVAIAALAVAGALLHATSVTLERAAYASPSPGQRYEDAVLAHRIAPWRVDPLPLAAAAALETGDRGLQIEAARMIDGGRCRLRPFSATLAEASGRLDIALGRIPSGASELFWAARLQPVSQPRTDAWDELEQRLEAGERGAGR